MYLHITFTDGSNPYIKFYYNENPLKSIKRDIRSWKRHYVVVDKYTDNDGDVELTVRCKTYAEEDVMKKKDKEYYARMKRRTRNTAIFWMNEQSDRAMSYDELADMQAHFHKLGKRYGLLKEFRENGVC